MIFCAESIEDDDSALTFLRLLILLSTNKYKEGRSNAISGVVAGIALPGAASVEIDFNSPIVKLYAKQIQKVEALIGTNSIY